MVAMPSWRPPNASDPDGKHEKLFVPLESRDSALAHRLVDRYGRRWLSLAGFPETRLAEVPDTVELVVAPDWTEPRHSDRLTLRLRSWYTGSTYWLTGWDGSPEAAELWVDQVADLQAANVEGDRRHGHTAWDE